MKTGLIILGIVLAVLILIEAFRQPKKASKQVQLNLKPVIQLTFKEMKDGNFKAVKRLNSYFELVVFKGSDYSINSNDVFIELYLYINNRGKQTKHLTVSKHILLSDLEYFINVIV